MYFSTGNRIGKSEAAGIVLMIVNAFLIPQGIADPAEFPVLNASITQDQASIVFRFCERLCMSPRFEHWVDDVVTSPFPTIRLAHGGELWARSTQYDCKYIEGHKFRWINFDEIALGTQESLDVLRMRVADIGGTVVGTGTPRGQNWYYRNCWRKAEAEIERARIEGRKPRAFTLTGSSYDNPHIDHQYLKHMESTLSDRQRDQKIFGLFTDDAARPFSADAIDKATNPDLNNDYEAVRKLIKGEQMTELERKRAEQIIKSGYWVNAWDLARDVDWTVCCALDISQRPWRLLYSDRYQRTPWPNVEADIKRVSEITDSREVIYDSTGMDVTGDHLDIEDWRVDGFKFTKTSKLDMLNNLVRCMEHGIIQIPHIEQLDDELHDYEWNDKALVQDYVMSLGMAVWQATEAEHRAGGAPMAAAVASVRKDWS